MERLITVLTSILAIGLTSNCAGALSFTTCSTLMSRCRHYNDTLYCIDSALLSTGPPNGSRYPLVGRTRYRRFAGTNPETRKVPKNAQTPTTCPGVLCWGSVRAARCFGRHFMPTIFSCAGAALLYRPDHHQCFHKVQIHKHDRAVLLTR
jgi:hypothetical protein